MNSASVEATVIPDHPVWSFGYVFILTFNRYLYQSVNRGVMEQLRNLMIHTTRSFFVVNGFQAIQI
jgi:hypothetical protein